MKNFQKILIAAICTALVFGAGLFSGMRIHPNLFGSQGTESDYPAFNDLTATIDPLNTTNATAKTAFSIPLKQNQDVGIQVTWYASDSTHTNAAFGTAQGMFTRSTGNVTLQGSPLNNIQTNITALIGIPTVTMVANTSTQSIDIKVTGNATSTFSWHLKINYLPSN
jgi:hypothetical protein